MSEAGNRRVGAVVSYATKQELNREELAMLLATEAIGDGAIQTPEQVTELTGIPAREQFAVRTRLTELGAITTERTTGNHLAVSFKRDVLGLPVEEGDPTVTVEEVLARVLPKLDASPPGVQASTISFVRSLGEWLDANGFLSDKQRFSLWQTFSTPAMKRVLEDVGVSFGMMERVTAPIVHQGPWVEFADPWLAVHFDYDAGLVDELRRDVPGSYFSENAWYVPTSSAEQLRPLIEKRSEFEISENAKPWFAGERLEAS